jgi:hypothetical protein
MFDINNELRTFYDEYVRLGGERRQRLADIRDTNLLKLKSGLDDLEAESGQSHPHYSESVTQGGFAMHTLNQDSVDDNDYDIDVAVIFNKSDLPSSPLDARKRVRDALAKRTGHMKEEPDLRTNAVTLWYQEGYHVDFAVYRRYLDEWGQTVVEHASTEWVKRGPQDATNWFKARVSELRTYPQIR